MFFLGKRRICIYENENKLDNSIFFNSNSLNPTGCCYRKFKISFYLFHTNSETHDLPKPN